MNKEQIAKTLENWSLSEDSSTERIHPSSFEGNNSYKVCYRFLANMLSRWKELGFDSFPKEKDAIEIAKKAHPYFVWLFKNERELEAFKSTYDFISDVWKDM